MPVIRTSLTSPVEVIENILDRYKHAARTTVIICSSRTAFLEQLIISLSDSLPEGGDGGPAISHEDEAPPVQARQRQRLLTPTLQLLAASQNVSLVFCPSISILRAYLSCYTGPERAQNMLIPPRSNILIILDLLALHHGTSEFTVQGLSRTLATAVSAAFRTKCDLEMVECKDANDPENPNRGSGLWDINVPLLSGSIKLPGEGARWVSRSTTIKQIAARWFTFEDN